ncbi:MAG: hypothetical protein ACQGVC_09565, partial [Myxococcota bacterium]
MRERRLHIAALALFAGLGMAGSRVPPAVPAELPAVSAPPPAAARPAPPSAVEDAVFGHLQRYARRSSLTETERRDLARVVVREARRHQLDPALVVAVM